MFTPVTPVVMLFCPRSALSTNGLYFKCHYMGIIRQRVEPDFRWQHDRDCIAAAPLAAQADKIVGCRRFDRFTVDVDCRLARAPVGHAQNDICYDRCCCFDAHYTSPTVIRAIYETIKRMGFTTDNILEPAMGVGNFFGMLPESMSASHLYGVELDSITGNE